MRVVKVDWNGTIFNNMWGEVRWIGYLTSQSTIFQSNMWRHIDVQAGWSWTYGRAPNAIDISKGSLTCLFKHWHGATLFIRLFRETAHLVAFYDTLRIRRTYSRLNPRVLTGGYLIKQNESTKIYSHSIPWLHPVLPEESNERCGWITLRIAIIIGSNKTIKF